MRKKKMIKIGILLQMIIVLIFNSNIVIANTVVNIPFYTPHSGIITFWHQDRMDINKFYMLEDNNGNIIYQCSESSTEINKTLVSKQKITDTNIIKVLKNGYPNHTKEELGCELDEQAYVATQEALYMICDNKNPEKYVTPSVPEQALIKLAKEIATKTAIEIDTNATNEIQIQTQDKQWQVEQDYLVKSYSIKVSTQPKNSKIEVIGGKDVFITDEDGKEKTTFKQEDRIQVKIPKNSPNQQFQLKLSANVEGAAYYQCKDCNNKEYIYIENGEHRVETTSSIRYGEIVNITILNQDNETAQPIAENVFQLLDENGNVLQDNLKTDNKGRIQLENINKGTYQIKQIRVIEGYTKIESALPLEVIGTENTITITIKNSKPTEEMITNTDKEINVVEENKQITQNNIKDITNIHTTNTFKEIINQTNETNWYNNRYFINTINKNNIYDKTTNHMYKNEIEEINRQKQEENEITNLKMTRQDYINYMDCIRLKNQEPPKLPLTGK